MSKLPVWAAAIAAGALLATAALAANAQATGQAGGHGPGKHARKPMPAFETMDANKDGGLTPAELKAGLADRPKMVARLDQMVKRIDRNADGKVQKAELEAWKARRAERHGQGGRKWRGGDGGASGQN